MIQKIRRRLGIKFWVPAIIFAAAVAGILTATTSPVLAMSGLTSDCTGCHAYQGGNLRITTDTASRTVAPGASFTITTTFTGGGNSRTEISWPGVKNNSLFNITPRVPFSAQASTASGTSTLTAPATTGTYTVRVYAAQSSPTIETDYKDMTITVQAITTYTISASASPAAGGTVTGGGAYNSGASVSLVATASSGYHFVNWTEGATVVSTSASYSFSASANRTLVANFAANPAAGIYTISASAGDNGRISPSGMVTVNSGKNRTFVFTARKGYHVANVLVDGISVSAKSKYTFKNVTSDHTISVTFAANSLWSGDDDHSSDSDEEDRHHFPVDSRELDDIYFFGKDD